MLRGEGVKINLKKVYRLWKLEKLSLPRTKTAKTASETDAWNTAES